MSNQGFTADFARTGATRTFPTTSPTSCQGKAQTNGQCGILTSDMALQVFKAADQLGLD